MVLLHVFYERRRCLTFRSSAVVLIGRLLGSALFLFVVVVFVINSEKVTLFESISSSKTKRPNRNINFIFTCEDLGLFNCTISI